MNSTVTFALRQGRWRDRLFSELPSDQLWLSILWP